MLGITIAKLQGSSEDTYRGRASDPLSLNLYTYCHNEPIMYIDPTGHWDVGDSDHSLAAQAQILEATKEYLDAKENGDKDAMEAAHQKAQDARKGNVYQDNTRVSFTTIANELSAVLSSKYATQAAKDDMKKSDMSFAGSTAARHDPDSRVEQNNIISTINRARKDTNVFDDTRTNNTTVVLKNEANYNIDEPWKNDLSDFDAACRRSIYGVGNDNDFADGLYQMLPRTVKSKIDIWAENNKDLKKNNPSLYNTKYADEVLDFYDATKEQANMFEAMDDALDSGNPLIIVAAGIVYGGVTGAKTKLKAANLPTQGKIRYIPPESWTPSQPLPKTKSGGYIDRFGNEWVKGSSRTQGQSFEWDIQLSNTGKNQLGWASRDGSHVNVSIDGRITHK